VLTAIAKLSRYWHTLRHLKPQQFYGRLWFKIYRPYVNALATNQALRVPNGEWRRPAARRASMLGPKQFRFLNQTHTLPAQGGWNDDAVEKLWIYNLHYFDDLNAQDAPARQEWHKAMISRWVAENPPTKGNAWEPYPTSLRIVNWVKWLAKGNTAVPGMFESLTIQAGWLARRLERHLLGNHLFANAKALVFAGQFFKGSHAAAWLDAGLKIIAKELPEQVLPDGGNFERSPMYHAIFLEDLLDLINLAGVYPGVVAGVHCDKWKTTASAMLRWLDGMCHPDGEITFFNDAAIGINPSPSEIYAYARRLGIFPEFAAKSSGPPIVNQFADSGYICLSAKNACAFLDVAPIGPDYLPGHAHADTLSFELSLFGERIIVNGGTSQYGSGAVRLQERGTSAHNTLQINGENSSEVWAGFRVARRAYPLGLEIDESNESVSVTCAHDGYTRLFDRPVHKRTWTLSRGRLVVRDRIEGKFNFATARIRFHPDLQIIALGDCKWALRLVGCEEIVNVRVLCGRASMEKCFYSSEFGVRRETQCLAICHETVDDIVVEISWSIYE
jgi:uncharacterized heparinase superfamily protein